MRKIFVSIIFLLALCVSAYADVVYTTDSGNMGLIKISGSDSAELSGIQYTGAGENSFLGSYWNGNNSRIILVDRTTDTNTSGDTALIFDPTNLSNPIDSEKIVLDGVYNTQTIAGTYNGRGIYFGSEASIHEFTTENFSPARSYTYKLTSSDKTAPVIKSIITSTYAVYALFSQEDSGDFVLTFDGQLRDDVADNFSRRETSADTSCMSWVHNSVALAHTEGVDFIGRDSFMRALSTDSPVKALCEDGGSGFYFAEQKVSGDSYITILKHRESSNTKELFTDTAGKTCQLMRDTNNNILAGIIGSKIIICNMNDDTIIGEYGSSSLGGLPRNIAMSYVNGDDGKTKSGCEVAGTGIIMLLAGALIFMKQH